MADSPGVAVRKELNSAVGALTYTTNLFDGPVRPPSSGIPHEAVFCLTTGGPKPESQVNANTGPDLKRGSVQVRIRSNAGKFTDGETLANTVWTAIQRATITGYMSVTCAQSEPVYLGQDDTEHHEWSVNVDTMREE